MGIHRIKHGPVTSLEPQVEEGEIRQWVKSGEWSALAVSEVPCSCPEVPVDNLSRWLWPLNSEASLVPLSSHLFHSEASDPEVALGNPPRWPCSSPESPRLFLMTWRFSNKENGSCSGQASLASWKFCIFIQSSRDDLVSLGPPVLLWRPQEWMMVPVSWVS